MPVIAIASPKGGAGKSTTAVILGTQLAHYGAEVTLLDCGPQPRAGGAAGEHGEDAR
ncbi:ParA family protein [Gluconobacter albidus]|uniref:ParA family protein n=1 Tax=Gluconobacter albidus TaxID=318683 RepID=UPI001C3FDDB0|nr:ParA family protein [Gluconobacter albidus]